MNTLISIIIGFVLALPIIFFVRKTLPNKDHAFWRIGLVIAAVIYPIFVLIRGQMEMMPMEIGGVFLYGFLAWLSKKYSLIWLAVGWLLHMCWDVFLHSAESTPYVPAGYAMACLGFDIAIAGYIGWLVFERGKRRGISFNKLGEKI